MIGWGSGQGWAVGKCSPPQEMLWGLGFGPQHGIEVGSASGGSPMGVRVGPSVAGGARLRKARQEGELLPPRRAPLLRSTSPGRDRLLRRGRGTGGGAWHPGPGSEGGSARDQGPVEQACREGPAPAGRGGAHVTQLGQRSQLGNKARGGEGCQLAPRPGRRAQALSTPGQIGAKGHVPSLPRVACRDVCRGVFVSVLLPL